MKYLIVAFVLSFHFAHANNSIPIIPEQPKEEPRFEGEINSIEQKARSVFQRKGEGENVDGGLKDIEGDLRDFIEDPR